MRNGRWSRKIDFGEGSENSPGWPEPLNWFKDNRDFVNITEGLLNIGFDTQDVDKIMGLNWLHFFEKSFR